MMQEAAEGREGEACVCVRVSACVHAYVGTQSQPVTHPDLQYPLQARPRTE